MLEVHAAILVLRTVRTFTVGLWITLLLCVVPGRAATNPAETAAPSSGRWVADTIGLLNEADRATLNRLGDAVHAADPRAALFVITIDSTGATNHRSFATAQLNQRGPRGSLPRGVLILLARADRKAEIVLGDSLYRESGSTLSDRIMRNTIVAAMRRGDVRSALVGGARDCAEVYFDLKQTEDGQITRLVPAPMSDAPAAASVPTSGVLQSAEANPTPAPAAPAELDLERPSTAQPSSAAATPPASSARPRPRKTPSNDLGIVLTMAAVMAGVVGGGVLLLIKLNGPRKCPTCRQAMQELPPAAEGPHLSASEKTEERVGSVNYRIWHCAPCGKFEKTRHGRWFSGFSGCPKCQAETRREISRTVSAATTLSTGMAEITEHCEHCGYHHVSMRTLPRLPQPTRSSSSSGFGSGGSSSGRSSSGRGSSGSW